MREKRVINGCNWISNGWLGVNSELVGVNSEWESL